MMLSLTVLGHPALREHPRLKGLVYLAGNYFEINVLKRAGA